MPGKFCSTANQLWVLLNLPCPLDSLEVALQHVGHTSQWLRCCDTTAVNVQSDEGGRKSCGFSQWSHRTTRGRFTSTTTIIQLVLLLIPYITHNNGQQPYK